MVVSLSQQPGPQTAPCSWSRITPTFFFLPPLLACLPVCVCMYVCVWRENDLHLLIGYRTEHTHAQFHLHRQRHTHTPTSKPVLVNQVEPTRRPVKRRASKQEEKTKMVSVCIAVKELLYLPLLGFSAAFFQFLATRVKASLWLREGFLALTTCVCVCVCVCVYV